MKLSQLRRIIREEVVRSLLRGLINENITKEEIISKLKITEMEPEFMGDDQAYFTIKCKYVGKEYEISTRTMSPPFAVGNKISNHVADQFFDELKEQVPDLKKVVIDSPDVQKHIVSSFTQLGYDETDFEDIENSCRNE